jgi:hypothetical protein
MKYENLVLIGSLQTENITSTHEKSFIVDDVFTILQDAYENVTGGLHFKNKDELINTTDLWKVIYLEENIVGIVIYKAKKGLKMVALGIANFLNTKSQLFVKSMLSHIFKLTFANSWMEVSEGVEKFLIKNGGKKFFIKNSFASQLTGKTILSLDDDGYHYKREINGVAKTKIMIGTIKLQNIL